jgi:hypothetical protein
MNNIRMGIWRHYKGPLYQVLGLTHDANHDGRVCVLYIGLQLDAAHLGPRLAVRDLDDFVAYIDSVRVTGPHRTRRFIYLGPELTQDMLR